MWVQREKEHRYQRGKKCRRESRKGGITGKRKSRKCKWMMEMCQKREEEEHEAGKREEGAIRLSEK